MNKESAKINKEFRNLFNKKNQNQIDHPFYSHNNKNNKNYRSKNTIYNNNKKQKIIIIYLLNKLK